MSIASLITSAKGGSQATSSQPKATTKGVKSLISSATPIDRSVTAAPTPPPQSLPQKIGNGILKGATALTDFIAPGLTDVLSSDIAHVTADARTKPNLPLPTGGQNIGAALQLASLVVPATSAESIAANLAKGAFTRAALSGGLAGAQYGVLGGAGETLSTTPGATDKEIFTNAAKQGLIGAGAGTLLGVGGAAVSKGLSKLLSKAQPIAEDVERSVKVPVQSEAIENKVPVKTPLSKQSEYARSQGYEPYTPPEQLPTIQTGRLTSDLPTIQTEPKVSNKLGDLTIEPIQQPSAIPSALKMSPTATQNIKVPETPPIATNIPKTSPGIVEPKVNGSKVSKVASSINAKAIEAHLTSGFKELAGFESQNVKEQAPRIAELLTDIPKTRAIIRGEAPLPKDISGSLLIHEVEDHATRTGNGEMLRELASSPLTSATSHHASELALLAQRNPESPLKAISDINKAREGRIERKGTSVKKTTAKDVSEAQKEIKKSAPKKEDWNSFITSITC